MVVSYNDAQILCYTGYISFWSMVIKYLKNIILKLQFLYRQHFLNPEACWLLCNFVVQPHFDYACISGYPLVSQ